MYDISVFKKDALFLIWISHTTSKCYVLISFNICEVTPWWFLLYDALIPWNVFYCYLKEVTELCLCDWRDVSVDQLWLTIYLMDHYVVLVIDYTRSQLYTYHSCVMYSTTGQTIGDNKKSRFDQMSWLFCGAVELLHFSSFFSHLVYSACLWDGFTIISM